LISSGIVALDPCVGEGAAFKMLLDHLGAKYENACASELTKNRGATAQELLKGANVLYPADFIVGTSKPNKSFSFIYCNPPYGDEIGGGYRIEASFADKVADLMCIGGVVLFVVPKDTWNGDYNFRRAVAKHFVDITVVYPEAADRPYNETLVFGVRKDHKNEDWAGTPIMQMRAGKASEPYKVPGLKHACRNWKRTCLTEEELKEAILTSEIECHIDVPDPIRRGTPPLALGEGHNGMLVASGQAPPVVVMRDDKGRMLEVPHLVRGVSKKAMILVSSEEIEGEGVSMTQKDVYTETFVLHMVVLTKDGEVIHLKNGSASTARPGDDIPGGRVQVLASGETQTGTGGIAV